MNPDVAFFRNIFPQGKLLFRTMTDVYATKY